MDSGRFVLQPPGWDNSSALEGYEVYHDRNLRNGGAFGGPFRDEDGYGRMPYTREPVYERDAYPAPSNVIGHWPHINRHSIDDGISIREAQSQEHENIYRDYGVSKPDRWELDGVDNDYEYRHGLSHGSREGSRDLDYDYSRHEYESDKGNDRRERDWSRRHGRSKSRDWSSDRERHASPDRERHSEHSHSLGNDGHSRRSKSPRGRSRLSREDSHEESHQTTRGEKRSDRDRDRDRERDRDRDYRGSRARDRDFEEHDAIYGHEEAVPSATLVVKGLSPKTLEDDLYQALAEWGPLKHVRVIKERNSGASRGFAFIDFPSMEAAKKMMEDLGPDGLVISGRRLCFEYSSKPTGGGASQLGDGGFARLNMRGNNVAPADWMCIVCGCVNFARRTLCFQCNESRTDDAPAADVFNSSAAASGRKGIESAPTHVLVVRGLEESVDEETLHYEFSKYAPIKDLRLIRDKFTHVSRGFAFVHFNSVEDATRALAKSNGTELEKNGQVLKVAFAKSVHGPGSSGGLSSQSSSLAAAAIEAATFAQQYDSGGYASKDSTFDKSKPKLKTLAGAGAGESNHNAVSQSGFVWDEASGYYYSASTGFYYDGHRGLYYDGNSGVWYSYNQETQQYVPYTNQSAVSTENPSATESETSKLELDGQVRVPEVTQSKDDMTATNADSVSERKPSLAEAVAAAAAAAQIAAKKEKEKMKEREKEMRLALKKKMNNVLTLWKQRQLTGSAVPEGHAEDHNIRHLTTLDSGNRATTLNPQSRLHNIFDAKESSGMTDATAVKIPDGASDNLSGQIVSANAGMSKGAKVVVKVSETPTATVAVPFKTDASALGSYGPTAGTKRRFSETPQPVYRDRAAERRSLYGSSLTGESTSGYELDDKGRDIPFPPGVMGRGSRGLDMPFPPGVGPKSDSEVPVSHDLQSYEVITSEKAIDESNVGNRMLRNMGWQEGTGLGKGGTGIVEPVQPQGGNERAGLGCQTQRKIDARFETQPGDSYRIVIQKKALARFHEMM